MGCVPGSAAWLGAVALAACASVPLATLEEDQEARRRTAPPDKALVYVFRDYMLAPMDLFPVYANSRRLGDLAFHTYLLIETDPGELLLSPEPGGKVLALEVEPARKYYVERYLDRLPILPPLVVLDTPRLAQVTEERGKGALGRLVKVVSVPGVYVPVDLDDCFRELTRWGPPAVIEKLRSGEAAPGALHLGLGMALRNRWGLWRGSRLARYFDAMGIHHPDDMSGIILESYAHQLRGEPLDLEGQIARTKQYWERANVR